MEVWLKGSPLESNKEALSQANVLRQIEDLYGKFDGAEIIKEHQISSRVRTIIAVLHYSRGPVFGRFQVYETSQGNWAVTEFNFHTDADTILPQRIVFGD
jgi:hypothetical protein